MSDSKVCPNCSETIPADAPGGICPKCVAAGMIPPHPPSEDPAGGPQATPPMSAGDLDAALPDYTVEEIIGAGGMGVVYRAAQNNLNREVAIKVMPKELAEDPTFVERFGREAKALAALNHPNIVTVHDTGMVDGICFIVMELVDGASLREVLATGNLQPKEALAIVSQLCAALQFAHDTGIVHRDIKPENILLTRDGHVKITDFGLVKLLGDRDLQLTLTNTREAMGSVRYMAPEQLAGAGDADHRADIYSMGVVFYELLTGEVPAGRFDPPSRSVEIDVRLDEVVMRTLDAKPERRYQQAKEVRTEVEHITSSHATTPAAQPSGPVLPDDKKQPPRISKKAVVGAIWAPFFFLPLVPFVLALSLSEGGNIGPLGFLELVILLVIGLPCFLAPFGTTLLGLTAMRDIRQSNGEIYGLRLGFLDLILFPMLALDAVLIVVGIFVIRSLAISVGAQSNVGAIALMAVLGILVIALDCVIAMAVWKRVVSPQATTPKAAPASG